MLLQVVVGVVAIASLYSLRQWSEGPNTNAALPPTDDVWRGLAAEIDMSPGSSEIEGTLNGVQVRLRAGAGEYWLTANPGALILHHVQFTDQASLSGGRRIATGDVMFDRRFKTTGDPKAVFAVLSARTRIALLKSSDPLTLRSGGVSIKLPATISTGAAIARLHALVVLAQSIVPKDPDAALLSNMTRDPSDDVRRGAYLAAEANPATQRAAINRAAKSRWPELRLLASDAMSGSEAAVVLQRLLASTASSVVRCNVVRRVHQRTDIDPQPFVSLALSSGDMAVARAVRELGFEVGSHVETIRSELSRAQQDPTELVILFGPYVQRDDCPVLLSVLEEFSASARTVAALLGAHGGQHEAQRINALADNEQLDDPTRIALRAAARQIAARSKHGSAGRLGIASPARHGAVALVEHAQADVHEATHEQEREADTKSRGSS